MLSYRKKCSHEYMCDWLNEACSINHFDRSVRVEVEYSIGTSLFTILLCIYSL